MNYEKGNKLKEIFKLENFYFYYRHRHTFWDRDERMKKKSYEMHG